MKIETKWKLRKIGEISTINYGTRIVRKTEEGNIYPVYGGGGKTFRADSFNRENCYVISRFGMSPECVRFVEGKFFLNDSGMSISSNDLNSLHEKYLNYYLYLNQEMIYLCGRGVAQKNIDIDAFNAIRIPLPPKVIQEKVVVEIENLEEKERKTEAAIRQLKSKIIVKANSFYQHGKLQKLGLLCDPPMYGANEKAINGNHLTDYRYIRITDIKDDGNLNNDWRTAEKIEEKYILKEGDFLFARSGATAGKTFIYKEKFGKAIYAGYLIRFKVKKNLLNARFLNFILKADNYQNWVLNKRSGTAQPNINAQQYSSFEIPFLTLPEQQNIVSEIEKIETEINALQKEITQIPQQKEIVLRNYL